MNSAVNSSPRLIVADDNPPVLAEMAHLAAHAGEVVAALSDGPAAVAACDRFDPDVVILDIAMPGMTGFEAAREMLDHGRHPRIIFVSTAESEALVRAAFKSGGHAFVNKLRMSADLEHAIQAVLAGESYVARVSA